jgi:aminoglycoside/choline kinase family phosphotransferase
MSQSPNPITPSTASPMWADPLREARFDVWFASVQNTFGLSRSTLRLASADASFRRYLRVDSPGASLVIMDAPPALENCQPFVRIAQLLAQAGLKGPQVLAWDEENGFLLLTDLGAQTMMQVIDPQATPPLALYMEAVDTLVQWQLASQAGVLPPYDHALLTRELELFPQWYIGEHRKVALSPAQRKTLDEAFASIISHNLAWPSVYVHRDFMPRNLMVGPGGVAQVHQEKLGVLDFQDAVYGPITYDIASLIRDAFLSWDEDFCLDVTIRYWEKARKAGLPVGEDFGEFYRGVEWMGLQRHLKIAGIFARLTLRDGKPQYLADTPRFIAYIGATCARYRELKPLLRLVEQIEGVEAPTAFTFGRV